MSTDLLQATCDKFLGGQVQAYQPKKGYRSGSDAVLLAAAVNAQNGETCLEFGCGVGVASLCLAKRLAYEGINYTITGIDIQSTLIDLAQKNTDMNDLMQKPEFFVQDIKAKFSDWVHIQPSGFHHVFANPPYFRKIKVLPRRMRARRRRMWLIKLIWIFGSNVPPPALPEAGS